MPFEKRVLAAGASRSLHTFREDLVVERGWNAVFAREVEAAGFLRPVLRVMSRLLVGTEGELPIKGLRRVCCLSSQFKRFQIFVPSFARKWIRLGVVVFHYF